MYTFIPFDKSLKHLGRDKMAANLQTTHSNSFSSMETTVTYFDSNRNVVMILMKYLSPGAPEIVKMTTFSDENFVKMATFALQ